MRPRLALLLGALVVPALPLLAAAPAQAATNIICVNRPDDSACVVEPATLTVALQVAQTDGMDSVIRLGPGTALYADGPFVFDGTVDGSLTVQGSNNGTGPNSTTFPAGAATPYVTLTGAGATLRNVRIEVGGSAGVGLAATGASIVQNVIVADTAQSVATSAVGIRLEGARIENTTVSLFRGAGNTGIQQLSGPAVVSRVSVRASDTGVAAQGGPLAIDNSVLNLDLTGQAGLRAEAGSTVDARHLTVVGGATGSRGVLASSSGAAAAVTLVNSIVRGPTVAASGTAANLAVHHSDVKTPVAESGGTVTVGAGNLPDVDPAFIDPGFAAAGGGDLALRSGSPVVDKGDPLTSTGDDRNGNGRAFDGDGNGSPIPDMGAYELRDITAPRTTITAGPEGPTNDNTPVFGFRTEAGATPECRVDAGAWQPCTSPVTTTPLSDGPHTFAVRATDEVFNVETTPAVRSFKVDTVKPNAKITKKPPKRFFKKRVKFKFAASEAGATFQCKLDKRAWRKCGSTYRFNVKVGKHRLLVRAVDAAGNVDRSPARHKFKRLKRR